MKLNKNKLVALGLCVQFLVRYCAAALICRKKRFRRFGVRLMNRKRNTEGLFVTLIKDMITHEWDEDQCFKYTRMTKKQFIYLHQVLSPYLKKDSNKLHVSSEQRLIMTLHYLSEGCSMQEIAWNYRVGKATARNIIKETCEILWDTLSPSQLPVPKRECFTKISKEFFDRWNIPNCIGVVDGKHVVIRAPQNSGSEYFNYKKSFSIILMACCDAFYRFTMIDIGAAGAKSNISFPHFVVADAAFPLHHNVIRPYPGSNLGEKKNICNYRISRARRTIESTFGILSQRWQILRKPIMASVEVCDLIVQATIVLHNYLQNSEMDIPESQRRYCPTEFLDCINENGEFQSGIWINEPCGLRSVNKVGSNNPTNLAKQQRDVLANHFVSQAGSVPWQEAYVNRGALPT